MIIMIVYMVEYLHRSCMIGVIPITDSSQAPCRIIKDLRGIDDYYLGS